MFNKKREREEAEIPDASMADIAFLLLIFFLVTTTIDVDTGIGLVLPPPPDESQQPPPIKEKNLLKILVNSSGAILIEGEPSAIGEVKQKVMDFIDNNGVNPDLSDSPDKAIVSLKTDRQTPYSTYITMLDEVKGAYKDLRDQESRARFGKEFDNLGDADKSVIKDVYPLKISEAEPDEGS